MAFLWLAFSGWEIGLEDLAPVLLLRFLQASPGAGPLGDVQGPCGNT